MRTVIKLKSPKEVQRVERSGGWYWYLTDNAKLLERYKCGKWMYFFTDQEYAMSLCDKVISKNICYECKCTDMAFRDAKDGVICFYVNSNDMERHRRVIQFMLDNNLIKKTKNGRLHNISFKFNEQTYTGQYGTDFNGLIKLADFLDLDTGEWLDKRTT